MSKHKLTIEDIKKMSPEEVNEKWEDIKPVLIASGEPAPADDFDEEDDE